MAFRVNARHFAITYPQCDLSPEEFCEQFGQLHGDSGASFRAASELHDDGGLHWHVALTFPKRYDLTNARAWDLDGFHPNIQAARDYGQWFDYISKDGVFFDVGDPSPAKRKVPWSEALAAGNKADFLATVRMVSPRDYILQNERVHYYADQAYNSVEAPYQSKPEWNFRETGTMNDWKMQMDIGGKTLRGMSWCRDRDTAGFPSIRPLIRLTV